MQKLLIILACVPVTPIAVGVLALYRRWTVKRGEAEVLAPQVLPAVE